jgi:hypothetical protein
VSKYKKPINNLWQTLTNALPGFAITVDQALAKGITNIEIKDPMGSCYKLFMTHELMSTMQNDPVKITSYITSKLFNAYPHLAFTAYPVEKGEITYHESASYAVQPKNKSTTSKLWGNLVISDEMLKQATVGPFASNNQAYYKIAMQNQYYTGTVKQPQGLVDSHAVYLNVGPDLTQFNEGMKAAFNHLSKMADTMGAEFAQAAEVMSKTVKQLTAILEEQQLEKSPGQAITNHPTMATQIKCPKQGCGHNEPLNYIIIHLNDRHKWTREQIADWLDTLDEQPVFYPKVDDGEALAESA